MTGPPTIDLNCDLGEDPGAVSRDEALMEVVTSVNIACGGHAGDDASMKRFVRAAQTRGVAVGAHPSYPDRAGFGRVPLRMKPEEIEAMAFEQVRALVRVAVAFGGRVVHAKPHGALYHAAAEHVEVARAVARGTERAAGRVALVGLAGSPGLEAWRAAGYPVAAEAFADRRYEGLGLRPRGSPGALIDDPAAAAAQALSIARGEASLGAPAPIKARTLCIHSDTANALEIARAVRAALEAGGFVLAPFTA